jgi:MFS family permease
MRLIIPFAALFASVVLLQLGAGGLAPLDAISGLALGFSTAEVGMLGSAHFLGFFLGCWVAPRLMGSVGHARAFAGFVAMGTIGTLAHMMIPDPVAWAVMRMMAGACAAGAFTVIEAWLQAQVTNETRGRTMGVYRVVDIGGSLSAQLVIALLPPAEYVSYNVLALLTCAALFPVTLSRVEQPETPAAPRLRPGMAWAKSPLAVAGVVVSGVTGAAFRMVGPVYGVQVGLATEAIALFLAAYVLGGALAQYPAGWLADRFDRRWVLIWFSAASVAACAVMVAGGGMGGMAVWLAAILFGATTFPIYSISAAHAHDHVTTAERVELSAALMFLYAVGAIGAPYVASVLIEGFGPASMFWMVSVAHVALVVFGLIRMRARPSPEARTRFVAAPRQSFLVGRLTGRLRDRE